jgi:hypothetical protein
MSKDWDSLRNACRDPRANLPENVRATIHLYAWAAFSRLAVAVERAEKTKWETAARAAYAELERLLEEVEADAARAGMPLVRPPPFTGDVKA